MRFIKIMCLLVVSVAVEMCAVAQDASASGGGYFALQDLVTQHKIDMSRVLQAYELMENASMLEAKKVLFKSIKQVARSNDIIVNYELVSCGVDNTRIYITDLMQSKSGRISRGAMCGMVLLSGGEQYALGMAYGNTRLLKGEWVEQGKRLIIKRKHILINGAEEWRDFFFVDVTKTYKNNNIIIKDLNGIVRGVFFPFLARLEYYDIQGDCGIAREGALSDQSIFTSVAYFVDLFNNTDYSLAWYKAWGD